jgi:transcriptional regulator with XRE-family HTH domain
MLLAERVDDSRATYGVTRRRNKPSTATRLEAFLQQHGILPAELARASGCSRQALVRTRRGRCEPTRRFMAAVLGGARRIVGSEVSITDLFDFEDGSLPSAKEQRRRVKPPGRPGQTQEDGTKLPS